MGQRAGGSAEVPPPGPVVSPPCVSVSLVATFIYEALARKGKTIQEVAALGQPAGRLVFLLRCEGCDDGSTPGQDRMGWSSAGVQQWEEDKKNPPFNLRVTFNESQ